MAPSPSEGLSPVKQLSNIARGLESQRGQRDSTGTVQGQYRVSTGTAQGQHRDSTEAVQAPVLHAANPSGLLPDPTYSSLGTNRASEHGDVRTP